MTSPIGLRPIFGIVISPPTTTILLFANVSHATRLFGSCVRHASRIGVGNGIADFVGMAFADGLGGKNEVLRHKTSTFQQEFGFVNKKYRRIMMQ